MTAGGVTLHRAPTPTLLVTPLAATKQWKPQRHAAAARARHLTFARRRVDGGTRPFRARTRELPWPLGQGQPRAGGAARRNRTGAVGREAPHRAVVRFRAPQRPVPQRGAKPRRPTRFARGHSYQGRPQRGDRPEARPGPQGGKNAPARSGGGGRPVRFHTRALASV